MYKRQGKELLKGLETGAEIAAIESGERTLQQQIDFRKRELESVQETLKKKDILYRQGLRKREQDVKEEIAILESLKEKERETASIGRTNSGGAFTPYGMSVDIGVQPFISRTPIFMHGLLDQLGKVKAQYDAIVVSRENEADVASVINAPVSYTHLTLPTICSV